jgi:type II secretory pathway pseudopilin PulG
VAIILIIAAIAIPNLIRSRIAANEASSVAALRTLTTAYVTYSATFNNGLPPDLNTMQNPAPGVQPDCDHAGLVDNTLAGLNGGTATSFVKSGYTFTYAGANALLAKGPGCTKFGFGQNTTSAVPVAIGGTGQRGFLIDQTGVIYYSTTGAIPVPGVATPTL